MRPEDIDDLFKGKLEDHSSELPSPLWNRLEERMQQQQAKPEHAVDAQFKQKLQNHGTPLPAGLWGRIEDRMNPEAKKVRPMWVWYAAASVALLLSVLGFFRINTGPNNTLVTLETNTQKTETAVKETPSENLAYKTETVTSAADQALPKANETEAVSSDGINSEIAIEKGRKTENAVTQPAASKKAGVREEKTSTDFPQANNQENLLALKAAEPKKQGVMPENASTRTTQPEMPAQATVSGNPLNVEIIFASASPEMQLPETVDAMEEEDGSVKKKALFAKKVAKQLWSIKNGEKLDLQELGLAQNYSDGVKNKIQSLTKTINL